MQNTDDHNRFIKKQALKKTQIRTGFPSKRWDRREFSPGKIQKTVKLLLLTMKLANLIQVIVQDVQEIIKEKGKGIGGNHIIPPKMMNVGGGSIDEKDLEKKNTQPQQIPF